MTHRLTHRLLPTLLLAMSLPAATDEIEQVIVTGTRLEPTAASMPSHVTVIDRNRLDAMQHRSVPDALRDVAGIHVSQYGGRGGVTSVFLRGAEPNFTVVMIDGIKVNDPNDTRGGSFEFANLNLAEIERIEIVRGAQSAVYGSDALAGTINIVTRVASDAPGATVEGEVGQDGFVRGALHAGSPMGDRAAVSINLTATEDSDEIAGNAFDNVNVGTRLRVSVSDALTLDVGARHADANATSFPEDSGGPRLALLRDVDVRNTTNTSARASLRYGAADSALLNVGVGYSAQDTVTRSPGVATGTRAGVPPNASNATLERLVTSVSFVRDFSDRLTATAGIDFESERGSQQGSLDIAPGFSLPTDFALDRDRVGVFGEVQVGGGKGPLVLLALRTDNPTDFSTETSGRVGLQYSFDMARLFASWSEGFKLPSFFALGHGLVGNPGLRPEFSENLEVGFEVKFKQGRVGVTAAAFDSEYRDLVDFDDTLFTQVNRGRVTNQGGEISINFRPTESFRANVHVAYVDIDVSDGSVLRQRPGWRGGMSAEWRARDAIRISANWIHTGDAFDSSIPTGDGVLDSHGTFDIMFAFRPARGLQFWLSVDNLLNEYYEDTIGFPAPGRLVRTGVRYTMGKPQ